ncbi:helix-turn-helix domain-containing protein [Teichococcus wenyumeiae]|uniref:helix-turn-helix domain-containing protein n=1 Tax=Teichococcus wenyumeiae TaxID=2478470 RepID=UPI0034628103
MMATSSLRGHPGLDGPWPDAGRTPTRAERDAGYVVLSAHRPVGPGAAALWAVHPQARPWRPGDPGGAALAAGNRLPARAELEETTLLRRFKKATGLRPTEYGQQIRIAKAREALELTRRPVEQIAWQTGYGDPFAFRKLDGSGTGRIPAPLWRRPPGPGCSRCRS